LNWEGDKNPSSWKDGVVTPRPVSRMRSNNSPRAAGKVCSTRWILAARVCPKPLVPLAGEMQTAANLSFALCPLVERWRDRSPADGRLDELKATYLENLVSGKWTGTMNLTEPQAGSATWPWCVPALSRSPMALTRFLAPRSSSPGVSTTWPKTSSIWCWPVCGRARRRQRASACSWCPSSWSTKTARWARATTCIASASSTSWASRPAPPPCCSLATMAVPGAVTIVGQENRGLEYMFIMMNAARYGVGVQGIAIAERAYQTAVQYAKRPRAKPPGRWLGGRPGASIIHHPDVRRMLMTMRASTEGCRAWPAWLPGL
jgi:hypothetical protein